MRSYYLDVLGLSGNPSEKEIKSAYRRLSKRYHPDLNPSENAVERFIEIDKAYDYLSTVRREPLIHHEETTRAYDPRQEWKERIRRKAWEEERAKRRMMSSILRPFDYLFYAILIFNVILIIDILVPKKTVQQELDKVVIGMNRPGKGIIEVYQYDEVYFSDYFMRVDKDLLSWQAPGNRFSLSVSRIFNVPVSVEVTSMNNKQIKIQPAVGPYHFWIFLIPLLVITGLIYRFCTLTDDSRLTLAIFIRVPAILQLNVLLRYT